ncbi:DUF1622 domain-containing protein [Arenibaculum sp.]|jgi:uncharacterized membrane protein|uniref:DUF1622 domain-containing protein n=1 Tax=Arenibaculum sp. TaxID=2865862 RepID=UPI002E118D76|nr:DUF1622 domain-containing protein [Arenibaculum sp.]
MEETARGAAGIDAASEGTGRMAVPEWYDLSLHWITLGIETAGIVVIVVAVVSATAIFVAALAARRRDLSSAYHGYRTRLARGILLGLEFLVAADIIGTVAVDPTLRNVAILGLIVLIRTFLSFSLETEIEGRWPWKRGPRDDKGGS